MYFIGMLKDYRSIKLFCNSVLVVADPGATSQKALCKYFGKYWLWETHELIYDSRHNPIYFATPVREIRQDDAILFANLERFLREDTWGSWSLALISQIDNLVDFVNSDFSVQIMEYSLPSVERFSENIRIWRNQFVEGKWTFATLSRLLNTPFRVSLGLMKIQPPIELPAYYIPMPAERNGIFRAHGELDAEQGQFYVFQTNYPGVEVALTKEELVEYLDKFYPKIKVSSYSEGVLIEALG